MKTLSIETIEDKVGANIKELLQTENDILRLEELQQGNHPEMQGAIHQQLHELRETRRAQRTRMCDLKTEHIRQLQNRIKHVDFQLDVTYDPKEEQELTDVKKEINQKIDKLNEELKQYSA